MQRLTMDDEDAQAVWAIASTLALCALALFLLDKSGFKFNVGASAGL